MPSPVMTFEEFVERLRTDVSGEIEKSNKAVEEELPQILELKPSLRQRSLLIDPKGAQKHLRGLMEKQDKTDKFLDAVSAVRGEKVEITQVQRGHRDDNRDFILKGRNEMGINVDDLRLLLGAPKKKGEDIRNEVSQASFYKLLNLHVYREKASLEEAA